MGFFIYGLFYVSVSQTNINNSISVMTDEIKKVVHDTNRRIWQKYFVGDLFPTNVAPNQSMD